MGLDDFHRTDGFFINSLLLFNIIITTLLFLNIIID